MEQPVKKPVYFLAIRGIQALFGLIVLVLAAYFIHGASTSEIVWALIVGLLTIGVATVNILASRFAKLQNKILTVILAGVDSLFILFWLSVMGSNARLLSLLTVSVTCVGSYNNGQAINSNVCLTKRTNYRLVVGPVGRGIIGAIIAFSVLEMFLFAGIVVLTFLHQRRNASGNNLMPLQQTKVEADTLNQPAPVPQQNNAWAPPQNTSPYQPAPYQQPIASYQQQGSPAPYQQPVAPYQQPGSPAPYEVHGNAAPAPQSHPLQGHPPQQPVSPVYEIGQGNNFGYNAPAQQYPSPVASPVYTNPQQTHYPPPR